jgi:hypothetical protein
MKRIIFAILLFLSSCAPATISEAEIQIINVSATPSTQPWLADVFACAPGGTVIRTVDDLASADISLRLGEPDFAPAAIFQIDTEEILIVTHSQSPVQNLSIEEVREFFAGQGDPSVKVWVYSSGEDVQMVFEQVVMQGRSVTSEARLAAGPRHMFDVLVNDDNVVGILPRRWKVDDIRAVFTIPNVPVLALVENEPQGSIQEIIACAQK